MEVAIAFGKTFHAFEKVLEGDVKEIEALEKVKPLGKAVSKLMRGPVMDFLKYQANVVSDLCKKVQDLEDRQVKAADREKDQQEKLVEIERFRETNVVRASRAEMAAKLEVATTQVKLLDVDYDAHTTDPKELVQVAKAKLKARVMAKDQDRYQELVQKAVVQVLARQTSKRKARDDGRDIWTAPIVLTMQEKHARWEMEDLLRRSKIYPTFHWPKEFLGPMKEMREVLKKKVDESTTYVRMRPAFNEGKWRIRADVKPKEGQGKFVHMATWDVPPIDSDVRERVPRWAEPMSWASVVAGNKGGASSPPQVGGGGGEGEGMDL